MDDKFLGKKNKRKRERKESREREKMGRKLREEKKEITVMMTVMMMTIIILFLLIVMSGKRPLSPLLSPSYFFFLSSLSPSYCLSFSKKIKRTLSMDIRMRRKGRQLHCIKKMGGNEQREKKKKSEKRKKKEERKMKEKKEKKLSPQWTLQSGQH